MPLTAKGEEILSAMKKEYGEKKGESVFYASRNKGTISGVDEPEFNAEKKREASSKGAVISHDTVKGMIDRLRGALDKFLSTLR